MYSIRNAQRDDLPQIKMLALSSWLNAYDGIIARDEIIAENERFYTEDFHGLLLNRTDAGLHLFKVIVEQERVVGLIDFDFDDQRTWLMRFYVLPGLIGRGLGKRLMLESEQELFVKGRKEYFLLVHSQNSIGINYYERNGFERFPKFDQPQDQEICYVKKI